MCGLAWQNSISKLSVAKFLSFSPSLICPKTNVHRVTLFSDSPESLSDSQLSCNIIIIIISVLIVNALLVFGWLQSVSYLLSSLALYLRCVLRLVSFNAQLDSMRLLSSVTNGFRFFHVRYVSYSLLAAFALLRKCRTLNQFWIFLCILDLVRRNPSELSRVLLCGASVSFICCLFSFDCKN